MSRRGDWYDNAVMECFFSTVRSELADRVGSYGEAKMEIFAVYHNKRRPHSSLGHLTPSEYARTRQEPRTAEAAFL